MNNLIKVAVISAKNPNERNIMYRVLFDSTLVSWCFFTIEIQRIVSFFEKNNKPFVFQNNKNSFELELTLAFCKLANNFLAKEIFIPGDLTTCTISYYFKRKEFCKNIFPTGIPREIFLNPVIIIMKS